MVVLLMLLEDVGLAKVGENFRQRKGVEKRHNVSKFGSIKHHLGKNKSFVQCSISYAGANA